MSDYFFGRFADLVAPITEKDDFEKATRLSKNSDIKSKSQQQKVRVKELKSNFLNKYIYSAVVILILLIVVIFYFVSR